MVGVGGEGHESGGRVRADAVDGKPSVVAAGRPSLRRRALWGSGDRPRNVKRDIRRREAERVKEVRESGSTAHAFEWLEGSSKKIPSCKVNIIVNEDMDRGLDDDRRVGVWQSWCSSVSALMRERYVMVTVFIVFCYAASVWVESSSTAPSYYTGRFSSFGSQTGWARTVREHWKANLRCLAAAFQQLGYVETRFKGTATVLYVSPHMTSESIYSKLLPHQKCSVLPGMKAIDRKDNLSVNMLALGEHLGISAAHPRTTLLWGRSAEDIKRDLLASAGPWIVKERTFERAAGIRIESDVHKLPIGEEGWLAQQYIKKPLLFKGRKLTLRLYVLVTSSNPLKAWLHEEGIVVLAPKEYREDDIGDTKIHLTNALLHGSSSSPRQLPRSDRNKVLLSELYTYLSTEHGANVSIVWDSLVDVVSQGLLSGRHFFRESQQQYPASKQCFHLLGCDVLLDSQLQPWLLEFNDEPSLRASCVADYRAKREMLLGALRLSGVADISESIGRSVEREWLGAAESMKSESAGLKSVQRAAREGAAAEYHRWVLLGGGRLAPLDSEIDARSRRLHLQLFRAVRARRAMAQRHGS